MPAPASSSVSSTRASGLRTRRSPAEPASRFPATWHGDCSGRQNFAEPRLQRQARRRPVLPRRLRQEEHQQDRLHVAARRLRPRLAHVVDCRRQRRHRDDHRRHPHRHRLRHGPGREDRYVQGLLGQASRACRPAASTPTASPRSTTPCSTASTSSTTRSAASASRPSSTQSRRPSAARPTRACSSPTRPATAAPARAHSTTRRRGSPRSQHRRSAAPSRPSSSATAHATSARPRRRRCRLPCRWSPRVSVKLAGGGRRRRRAAASRARSTRPRRPARSSLCDRGVDARIDKSFEVKRAGGVGMVLINIVAQLAQRRLPRRPSVHIDHIDGAAVKAYITRRVPARLPRSCRSRRPSSPPPRRCPRSPTSRRAVRPRRPAATSSSRTSRRRATTWSRPSLRRATTAVPGTSCPAHRWPRRTSPASARC